MPYVSCEVIRKKAGPRENTIAVRTVQGHREFLEVPEGFLLEAQGKMHLSVALIGRDPSRKMALVELPFEADSGANRLWVYSENLLDPAEASV
jgi:hypothetical protein